jgi:hypothetical protein
MTPELLHELSEYPTFPESAKVLIEVIGREAAARLVAAWGGQEWPVPIRPGGSNAAGARRYDSLCAVIGESAAQRLVVFWSGCKINIPNLKEVRTAHVRCLIVQDFDTLIMQKGYSSIDAIFELGIRYGVTGKTVEDALKKKAFWKKSERDIKSEFLYKKAKP